MTTLLSNVTSASDNNETYGLSTGTKACETLGKQHKLLEADSYAHLAQANLKEGQIVIDMGCGNGCMTAYLAKTVGNTGHVYAIDASLDQLTIAKNRIKEAGLQNVTFIHKPIDQMDAFLNGKIDIVYGRFILMHVTDAKGALNTVINWLKPGGYAVLEEGSHNAIGTSHNHIEMLELAAISVALGQRMGGDYTIGEKLEDMCKDHGFENVTATYKKTELPGKDAMFLRTRTEEIGAKAVALGIATADTVKRLLAAQDTYPLDDPTFLVCVGQLTSVIAMKKAE